MFCRQYPLNYVYFFVSLILQEVVIVSIVTCFVILLLSLIVTKSLEKSIRKLIIRCTFINNFSATGTSGPSPPNIVGPRLPSLSFLAFRSLCSYSSAVSFLTRGTWDRNTGTRLPNLSYNEIKSNCFIPEGSGES